MEREPGWWIIASQWDSRSVAYLGNDGTLFPCVTEYDSYLPPGMYEQYRFIRRIDLDSLEVESA
jgi:hypothetical protein